MVNLDPEMIYEDYKNGIISKNSAFKKFEILIENSNNDNVRYKSLNLLVKIGENWEDSVKNKEYLFQLLENLMISDSSEKIRNLASQILGDFFLENALKPMKWSLEHEHSKLCLKTIFRYLVKIVKKLGNSNDRLSKFILIHELKEMKDKEFKIGLEQLIEKNKIRLLSNYDLSLILLNYFTITYLSKVIWRLNFSVKHCKVIELDFQFKGLTKIPTSIQNFDSLKKLSLRYNQISRIPKWISKLKYLEVLNLNVNSIDEISEEISSLSHLKTLMLWKNDIEKLPFSFSNLKSLEVLNLRLNQLKELPSDIGNLINLKELNLHDNKIEKLPVSISELKSLEKLNLSWNLLIAIPASIESLINLKILDLERNELSSIPDTIGKLENLEILNLSDNKLSKIPGTIISLRNLKSLNLSRNELEYIPDSLFSLTSLEELNVKDNFLKNMPKNLERLEDNGLKIYF